MKYFSIAFLCTTYLLLFACCGLGEPNNTARSFTPADFQKLRWLEGSWQGTGGGIDPFYEKYHFTNDTTIEIEFFADAALSKLTEKKNITLENGQIKYGTSAFASRLDDKEHRFCRKGLPVFVGKRIGGCMDRQLVPYDARGQEAG